MSKIDRSSNFANENYDMILLPSNVILQKTCYKCFETRRNIEPVKCPSHDSIG
jgi:hypothetical protein